MEYGTAVVEDQERKHMEQNLKSGFVALIGRPNVGKSTLMNQLVGQKVAITSNKPQTTRNRIRTVYTDSRGQIVFVDTPGIHQARNKMGEYMVTVAKSSIRDVDAILWIVEPGNYIGNAEQGIIEELKKTKLPLILVINKVDMVEKEKILRNIDMYHKACGIEEIIPASALRGHNLDDIIETIFQYLPYGPLLYEEDTLTDQPKRQIAAEIIREKSLHALDEEVPHGIAVIIERMKRRKGMDGEKITDISAMIICEKSSHKGIIIGKDGCMLKKIGSNARFELERMLDCKVNLKLWVKVKKDWRDSDFLMRNFGYRAEDI